MPIYNAPHDLYAAGRPATVICIGDSWFWHPLANLTSQLQNRFMNEDILLIGDSGKEAADLVDPNQRFLGMFQTALDDYAGNLTHVFISAGGNDFAGYDDFAAILKQNCATAATPADCYDTLAMQALFTQIFGDIETLIREVNSRAPNAQVRLHNYDYAIPDGRHALGAGQWLKVPMDSRNVPQPASLARGGFRREVVATLIDTFGAWQQNLAGKCANTVFVRTAGTVADDAWLDELHPKANGFKRIARLLGA
jgi:lysophospholipase L1-like esterase